MAIKITVDNVDQMVEAVKLLTGKRTMVGIPAKNADRDPEDGPITNAAIGYINETGAPERNIPPRPHLAPGIRNASTEIVRALESAGRAALAGNKAKVLAGFEGAGMLAVSSVRRVIADGLAPPLSPRTIAARRLRRGVSAAAFRAMQAGTTAMTIPLNPLMNTGAYNQAITYEVREKK